MAKIIKERERKYHEKQELCFYDTETNEVRYGFPMKLGATEIVPCNYITLEPCTEDECLWWKNYLRAKQNKSLYSKVEVLKSYYTEPAVAICECKKEITLDYDAEECPHCGRLHNLFGQELRPRKYWGEY